MNFVFPLRFRLSLHTGTNSLICNVFSSGWFRLALGLLALGIAWGAVAQSVAQDEIESGREAFSQRNYPWYDAENDQLQRIEMKARAGSKSAARHEIPEAPAKANRPAGTPNSGSGGSSWIRFVIWLVIGIFVAGVLGVLVWAFLRMESNREPTVNSVPRRTMAESIKELPFQLESANGDFRQLVQQAMARGDYRTAVIYLFSHVLVSLDQKGLIRLRKGKTNRQYLRELRPHRSLADYYQRIMVPFESVFFGDHEPDPEEVSRCWSHLEQFQTGVDQSTEVHHA